MISPASLGVAALRVLLAKYFEPRDSESHKAEEGNG